MKWRTISFFSTSIMLVMALFAGCSKTGNEKRATSTETNEVPAKAGVTVDAAVMGLKIESPQTFAWQPEIKGFGRVIGPAMLAAAFSDLESARSAAGLSSKEFERQQILAAENNASVRTVETAKAAAQRDELAAEAAQEKFKADWGSALVERSDREEIIAQIVRGDKRLVQLDLPVGENLPAPPTTARIIALANETKVTNAEFFNALTGLNPQTQGQSFFFLTTNLALPAGAAVMGCLKISGEPINGVIVPASAVLRHEGKGWIYLQMETNRFVRTEIPLDRLTDNGWFVAEQLSATNRIVVAGAEAVLSAELSGSGFNTGERD